MSNAPQIQIVIDTDDNGASFDASIFECGADGELDCLACFGTEPGETTADVAEQAVTHLEACAAEARRQFEAAGILKPKMSAEAPSRGYTIDWRTTAKTLSDRVYDIRQRLHAQAGESAEDAATRVFSESLQGGVDRAHRVHAEQLLAGYRALCIAGETDEDCVTRLVNRRFLLNRYAQRLRNQDASIQALRAALGLWRGTGASERTASTHRVTTTFQRPTTDVSDLVTVTWLVETEK